MKVISPKKTQLNDRVLWYDGDSTVSESGMLNFICSNGTDCLDGLFVDEVTQGIQQYNQMHPPSKHITTKESLRDLDFDWNVPLEFQEIDIVDFISKKWEEERKIRKFDVGNSFVRENRISHELKLFKELDDYTLLRTLIYIINTLCERSVIWGTGRGSGTSSYVLYLIGIHDVDSVEFQLDPNEFFHK